ncbi:hypothetical protein PSACC_01447 [Paramicrosporidium saccamoebae]|uniref:Uncharacterized protein n=1 Tax=Paramicrosporidium saccamoebae TaxID=1246581 RepID=A0A2H9TLW1_9FUNG|nr:hypothetical protein PSACC_01447 [Paramicrosporidium saccamoebae]
MTELDHCVLESTSTRVSVQNRSEQCPPYEVSMHTRQYQSVGKVNGFMGWTERYSTYWGESMNARVAGSIHWNPVHFNKVFPLHYPSKSMLLALSIFPPDRLSASAASSRANPKLINWAKDSSEIELVGFLKILVPTSTNSGVCFRITLGGQIIPRSLRYKKNDIRLAIDPIEIA